MSQRRALHLAVQQGRGGRAGGGDTDGGRGGPAAGGVAGEHRGPRQPGPGLALHLEASPDTPVPAPGHGPQGRTLAGRGGAELQRPGALVPLPRAHLQLRVQRHVAGRGQPLHQARVPGRGAHGLLAGPGAPGPAHPLRAELLLPKLAIYLISGFRVGGNLSDDNSVIRAIWSTCRRGEKLNWIGFEF